MEQGFRAWKEIENERTICSLVHGFVTKYFQSFDLDKFRLMCQRSFPQRRKEEKRGKFVFKNKSDFSKQISY